MVILGLFLPGRRFILRVEEASFRLEDPFTFNLAARSVGVTDVTGAQYGTTVRYREAVYREGHLPTGIQGGIYRVYTT